MRFVAAVLLVAITAAPRLAAAAQTHAYVLTSDYASPGGLDVVDLATRAVTPDVATVHSDTRIRWYGGLIYVVNRLGQDNIQIIDPSHGYQTLREFSVGNGSNPSDIAVVSATKAYVARYGSSRLLIVNPSTGDSTGAVPLGAFADADGIPDMDRMIIVGNRLFVSLQRLANFSATDTSLVAVIDTQTDAVIDANPALSGTQAIVLPATNPVTPFSYDPTAARLLIGCLGQYGVMDGGVAAIDPFALSSLGLVATEAQLGGDVLDVVWRGPTKSFAIVFEALTNTALIGWNPTTGQRLGTVFNPGGFSLADAALNDHDELYVCDNVPTSPGLYVFSAATGNPLAGPIDMGLPPIEVAFDASSDPASVDSRPEESLTLSAAWPQPARGGIQVRLSLPAASQVRIDVLDAGGRRIHTLAQTVFSAGRSVIAWDGKDASGQYVHPGIYWIFARASAGGAAWTRVVMTR